MKAAVQGGKTPANAHPDKTGRRRYHRQQADTDQQEKNSLQYGKKKTENAKRDKQPSQAENGDVLDRAFESLQGHGAYLMRQRPEHKAKCPPDTK